MKDPDEIGAWAETRYENGMVYMKFGGEGFDLCLQQIKGMVCSRYMPTSQEWSFPDTPAGHNDFVRCFGNAIGKEKDQQIDEASMCLPLSSPHEVHRAWDHQRRAIAFCSRLEGSVLNMEMGTGKTKVAIDLLHVEPKPKLALVLCPKTVIPVWGRLIEEHAPTSVDATLLNKGTVAHKTEIANKATEDWEWRAIEASALDIQPTNIFVINILRF